MDIVNELLDEIIKGGQWPPKRDAPAWREVRTYRAFLESDRDRLQVIANWSNPDRDYKVDPLGELIADAWADHLFGEDVDIAPANDSDEKPLDFLLGDVGDLTADLHEGERTVVGEGEAWWRAYVDLDVADVPILEWHSRDSVLPFYVGNRLLGCALVTTLPPIGRSKAVWRHFETHVTGKVEHLLFKGTKSRIGQLQPLDAHPDLVDLDAILPGEGEEPRVWDHGLPMLMGRITNGRRQHRNRKLKLGVSDFERVSDFLLDLNEAATIGAENMRLTAKKRVIVPESALRTKGPELIDNGDGTFVQAPAASAQIDAGEDVLVTTQLDQELGQDPAGMFKVLEYSFEADALIAWKRDMVETALTRIGITPAYVGAVTDQNDGYAASGTSLRLRLIPTTRTGNGKKRSWQPQLPAIVGRLIMLDALSTEQGGFGRKWADATTPPGVEIKSSLPQDPVEDAQVETTLVNGRLRSRKTSIKAQHPEWTDDQVDDELALIAEENPPGSALSGFGLA